MAIAVTAQIVIAGGKPLADYHSISIRQDLFAHHSFQVVVPYELLESARGDGFFSSSPRAVLRQADYHHALASGSKIATVAV